MAATAVGEHQTTGEVGRRIRREEHRHRPDVALERPSVRVHAHAHGAEVTVSIDLSGEGLHRRGYRLQAGEAPLRENVAAGILLRAGWPQLAAEGAALLDPMCGSGTFVIEAAEIAAELVPNQSRRFACEDFASFDPAAFAALRDRPVPAPPALLFHGFDRDAGAIRGATANAGRAGVADLTRFACQPVSALEPPEGPPGLVIANPPYGARIGNKKPLFALYGSLGEVLRSRFAGWRAAIVTSDPQLARATGLPFREGPPIDHGGIKVRLYQTGPLG